MFSLLCVLALLLSHTMANQVLSKKGRVLLDGCFEVRPCGSVDSKPKIAIGTRKNPAPSCKAILDNNRSSTSGPYYIRTFPTVTKVYCHMEDIPGCGGGGWTTIMKTNGRKPTFRYKSPFWSNKQAYRISGGQSGIDERETKLPAYWTLPFTSLCLGMKTEKQKQPNWILVNKKARSLFSVIADGKFRHISIGRNQWKSLVAGSSLQKNCNREGFNAEGGGRRIRIGILANEQNDCNSPDSFVGFGGNMCNVYTGSCHGKTIKTYGYILAQ